MKYLSTDATRCKGVRACETACAMAWFKTEDETFSCIRASELWGPAGSDSPVAYSLNVCNQCGACIDICPVKALFRNKAGIVMVNKKLCVGCFMCVGFCPTLSMHRAEGAREPFKCVSCGKCVKSCPHGALAMAEAPTPFP
jgi:anaerobic carbon-monoxide dehydrogenase iron sulfur subunit